MKASVLAILTLALVTACASAEADPPQPYLTAGETIETKLAADLDGDGNVDIVYVVTRQDSRALRILFNSVAPDVDRTEIHNLTLDPYPLVGAQLSVKDSATGNDLIFEDLTGGTTAVASTHRFRWDRSLHAMRLIGLDATLYSRTFAHDGREASWNLLTGDLVTRTLKLNTGSGDQAYNPLDETRTNKPSPPLRLHESPRGDDLLEWPG